jgi:pilus assembly protein CpaF
MEALLTEFFLDEYLAQHKNKISRSMAGALDTNTRFEILCDKVKSYLDKEWEREHNKNNSEVLVERQKKAILGYIAEVNYYKDKIREYLKLNNLEAESYPSWYQTLVDAIFHQNWGIAGIEPWMRLPESSSAKIIG